MSTPSISTIYASGVSIVTTSAAYDPSQEEKNWTRTLQAGDDPTDDYVYQYPVTDNSKPAPFVTWHTNVISKAAAAVANVPAPGYIPPAGVVQATGVVPIPMDQTLIPTGYTLTGTPFGLLLVSSAQPVVSGAVDTEEQAIKSELDEIAKVVGVPIVPVS